MHKKAKKGVGQSKNFGKSRTLVRPVGPESPYDGGGLGRHVIQRLLKQSLCGKIWIYSYLVFLVIGPIQKLTVPDFQHITSVYEQMQSEILEKPAKAR